MKEKSVLPALALIAAFCFMASGVTHFLMPEEQIHFAHGICSSFYLSLSQNALAFHIHYWTFAMGALLGLGVFIYSLLCNKDDFGLKVTGLWSFIGLTLIAVDFLHMHANAMQIAAKFSQLSASAQNIILARGLDRLDPYGISFNLIGIHIFYLNYLNLKNRDYAAWLSRLGITGGVLLQFVLIGIITHCGVMIDLAAGLGGIVIFPVWLIGYGCYMKEKFKKQNI